MKLKDIVNRISYFRAKKNLSARELSLIIGKHEGYINKLESNPFNLTTEVLLNIIEALEITESEFFAENYQNYKIDLELLNIIEKLPENKKKNIINLIQN